MTKTELPVIPKWPFFAGDGLLLALAVWIVMRQPHPLAPTPLWLVFLCVLAGCWLAVLPFLVEYRAALKLAESETLTDSLTQMQNLEAVQQDIKQATGIWQEVQDACDRTVEQARGIAERMAAEAKAFAEFLKQANDTERQHLRLEVEKLRRMEGDWVQIVVRILDHVFALYQAGLRSGQPNLVEQLTLFQNACRDIARRVGLVPIEAQPGEAFDPERHELAEPAQAPDDGAQVSELLATGFSYQGRLLRKPLVRVQPATTRAAADAQASAPAASAPDKTEGTTELEYESAFDRSEAAPEAEEEPFATQADSAGSPFDDAETTFIPASEVNAATEDPFAPRPPSGQAPDLQQPGAPNPSDQAPESTSPVDEELFDPFAKPSASDKASESEPTAMDENEPAEEIEKRKPPTKPSQSDWLFDS